MVSVPVSSLAVKVFLATVSFFASTPVSTTSRLFPFSAVQPEMVTQSPARKSVVRSVSQATVRVLAVKLPPVPWSFAPRGFTLWFVRSR